MDSASSRVTTTRWNFWLSLVAYGGGQMRGGRGEARLRPSREGSCSGRSGVCVACAWRVRGGTAAASTTRR
jgi:hypothetical protein